MIPSSKKCKKFVLERSEDAGSQLRTAALRRSSGRSSERSGRVGLTLFYSQLRESSISDKKLLSHPKYYGLRRKQNV
jgi:hypothetical protein